MTSLFSATGATERASVQIRSTIYQIAAYHVMLLTVLNIDYKLKKMKDNKNEFDKLTACTHFLEFESQWRLLKRRKVRNRNELKMEG